MNIKKMTAVFLTVLMLLSVLIGCSAEKRDVSVGYAEETMENGYLSKDIYDSVADDMESADQQTPSQPVTDRKLIRKIDINAETESLDSLLSAIDEKVAALGGYVQNRNVNIGSRYSDRASRRYANLTLRLPKDRLDEFVTHIQGVSNVTSSNETTDDVTLSYVATQSRMTALQKEEARLLELIDKAANLSELLELEKRLTEVRSDLETVTSQLRLYDNLVDYGTVTLSIQEVEILTPTQEPGFWSRISTGFVNSLRNLWNFLKELAIFLVVALPYLVPLAAVVLAVILLVRRSKGRKKEKKPPFKTDDQA